MYVLRGPLIRGECRGLNGRNRLFRVPLDWEGKASKKAIGSPSKSSGSQVTESLPCCKRG